MGQAVTSAVRFARIASAGLLILAAACGNRTPQPNAVAATSATTNQMNPLPRDQVRDGGKLVWPLTGMPVNFNYNELDGTIEDGFRVIAALMPSTFVGDAGATQHWNKNYLASEPVLVTTPKQVVTYEINPKAVWSDGTPITWQDFLWEWKALNGTDKAYQIAGSNGYEDIEDVARGKDDREVIVTFKHPYADWQAPFNPLYPAATNKSPKMFNEGWKTGFPVTAGPFKFSGIDQVTKTITVVRDDHWWGDRAKLDAIVYRVVDFDAQTDALANNEIDAMDFGADANKYNRAKAMPDVELRVARGPQFNNITLNGASPNLTDVRVRKAVAMAIDRTAVTRSMVGPLGIPPATVDNHIFMTNQHGYRDNSDGVGHYDPAAAARLLDEAGWPLVNGVRQRDGRPLQLRLVLAAAGTTGKQIAELIQNMLNQVGVKAALESVPATDFFDKYITPGQFDLTLFSWVGTPFPISAAKSIYAKPTRNAKGELAVQQNYARIGSDDIDQLFAKATQELDPQKAIDLANQIDGLIWQEVHSITFYQRPEFWACRKGLANFGAKGFADVVYQDIGWAK